jgi:type II secretory pathway component GspD/PulD (secretin)
MLFSGICRGAAIVSMNVIDADVREVLNAIAATSGMNLVLDDSVTGKISLQLRDVPVEDALELVCKIKNLNCRNSKNVRMIGSADKMEKNFGELAIIKLQHVRVEDVLEKAAVVLAAKPEAAADERKTEKRPAGGKEKPLAAGGKEKQAYDGLSMDESTNSLIVKGSAAQVAQVRQLLAALDVAPQQVSVEAEVVAVNREEINRLGVEWQGKTGEKNGGADYAAGSALIRFGSVTAEEPAVRYRAKVNALVTKGRAKILAKPQIMALNGKEAVINIGQSVPVETVVMSDNTTTTSVDYKHAGIILRCVPRILPGQTLCAKVHTEVSNPVFVPETKTYKFNTRSADTEVLLKDGETLVIGGLIGKEENRTDARIPILSDLPLIGPLFKTSGHSSQESEVIIFLTARIIK